MDELPMEAMNSPLLKVFKEKINVHLTRKAEEQSFICVMGWTKWPFRIFPTLILLFSKSGYDVKPKWSQSQSLVKQ